MQRKKVYQYDKNLNLIQEHESVTAASEAEPQFSLSGIAEAAGKRLRTHAGFIWSYTPLVKPEKIKIKN